jgi:hypothetical protein
LRAREWPPDWDEILSILSAACHCRTAFPPEICGDSLQDLSDVGMKDWRGTLAFAVLAKKFGDKAVREMLKQVLDECGRSGR